MVEAERTSATCTPACWYAQQPVCRCSCGGENHGAMLVDGAVPPQRESRKSRRVFRLAGVVGDEYEARDYVMRQGKTTRLTFNVARVGDLVTAKCPESAFGRWREVEPFIPMKPYDPWPWIIWECVEDLR